MGSMRGSCGIVLLCGVVLGGAVGVSAQDRQVLGLDGRTGGRYKEGA